MIHKETQGSSFSTTQTTTKPLDQGFSTFLNTLFNLCKEINILRTPYSQILGKYKHVDWIQGWTAAYPQKGFAYPLQQVENPALD